MKTPWRKLYVLSVAGALSWLGSTLTTFAVILRDKDTVGPAGVSLYMLAFGVPSILMAPISGLIADKFSSRQVAVPALLIMGLSSASLSIGLPLWWTPVALLLTAIFGTMVGPAMQAAEVSVTAPDDIPRVTGLMQSLASVGMLFGPPLGGLLVATTGYFWPFIIDAASFWILAIAFVAIGINRLPVQHEHGEKMRASEGLRWVFGDRLVRSIVILVATIVVTFGSLNVGEVFLVKDELHASTFIYGVVGAGFALGSILGSVLTATIKLPTKHHIPAVMIGLFTLVVTILFLGLAWNWVVAMILFFIAGVGNSALNVYCIGIIMRKAPPEALGRVNAAIGAVISSGSTLGIIICGQAIALFSVRPVIVVGAILAAVLFAIFGPEVVRSGREWSTEQEAVAP